jgi:hypothetical protein
MVACYALPLSSAENALNLGYTYVLVVRRLYEKDESGLLVEDPSIGGNDIRCGDLRLLLSMLFESIGSVCCPSVALGCRHSAAAETATQRVDIRLRLLRKM